MSENVVQLKPKTFEGLYELTTMSQAVLRSINDFAMLRRNDEFISSLGDERAIRAYFEAAENANHLLRRWFVSPKAYRLDVTVLKRDNLQEYKFAFFLSGMNQSLPMPMLSFHVNVYFAPTEALLTAAAEVFQPSFPFAISVEKAKEYIKTSGEKSVICSTEQLNQLITELDETASEFDYSRFGFITTVGESDKKVIAMGYRYFDPFIPDIANSVVVGFDYGGERKTSLVETRIELLMDYIDIDVVEQGVINESAV